MIVPISQNRKMKGSEREQIYPKLHSAKVPEREFDPRWICARNSYTIQTLMRISPYKGTRSHWAQKPCGGTNDRNGQSSGICCVVYTNATYNNLGISDVGTDELWLTDAVEADWLRQSWWLRRNEVASRAHHSLCSPWSKIWKLLAPHSSKLLFCKSFINLDKIRPIKIKVNTLLTCPTQSGKIKDSMFYLYIIFDFSTEKQHMMRAMVRSECT